MDVADYIKRAAQRAGYQREHFVERNMPTQPGNVVAVPFYGDLRSTFILSSYLLRSYKELHRDKYFVVCSWPGAQGLFPYADEFWSVADESATKTLALNANNFYNDANLATDLTKSLAEVLNITTARDLTKYYENGFTREYWAAFGKVRRFLPEIPSSSKLSPEFVRQLGSAAGEKVVVFPATKMRSRQGGRTVWLSAPKEFWSALLERLLAEGFSPVVYQNAFTYDMSRDFADRCTYLVPRSATDVLAAFRHVGCVLDVHTGISRWALAARCPFVGLTERRCFVDDKDYEIDDLTGCGVPRQYLFGFSTQLMVGGPADWKVNGLDGIITKLREFLPAARQASLPATKESFDEVPYEAVRLWKARRLGAKFIRTSKQR